MCIAPVTVAPAKLSQPACLGLRDISARCMQAAAVGKVPRQVLFDNADALARKDVVPWARIVEAGSSPVSRPTALQGQRQAGPLDHN